MTITEDYLDLIDQSSARQTYINNRRSFELYAEFLASRGLDEKAVALVHLRDFLKDLLTRYKPSTVEQHAIHVKAAYEHAHALGIIPTNPTSGFEKLFPKGVDYLPETFTAAELRAMNLGLATEREDTIFNLLLWTGCRAAEIRPLRWEPCEHSHVDFGNDQLVILGKNSKIRFVPLHPILRAKLDAAPKTAYCVVPSSRGEVMSHTWWTNEVTGIMERAGVEKNRKSHVFRKSLNTNLVRQGVKEHVLDSLFGWAPATVRTKHYSGVAKDEVRDALLLAYADDPIVTQQHGLVEDARITMLKAEIARLTALKTTAKEGITS